MKREVVNTRMIADLRRALGDRRLCELLVTLQERLARQVEMCRNCASLSTDCRDGLHRLRGSADSLGLPWVAEALAELEAVMLDAAAERDSRLEAGLDALHARLVDALQELARILPGLPGGHVPGAWKR